MGAGEARPLPPSWLAAGVRAGLGPTRGSGRSGLAAVVRSDTLPSPGRRPSRLPAELSGTARAGSKQILGLRLAEEGGGPGGWELRPASLLHPAGLVVLEDSVYTSFPLPFVPLPARSLGSTGHPDPPPFPTASLRAALPKPPARTRSARPQAVGKEPRACFPGVRGGRSGPHRLKTSAPP